MQPSLGCCVHNTRRLNCVPSSFFTCAQFCCNIYFTAVQVFESCVGECGVTSWLLSANWAFFRAPVVRVEVSAALMWSALWCCSTENTYRGVWTSWYLQSFVVLTAHSEMAVMLTLNQFRHSLETCGVFCRQVFNFQEQKKTAKATSSILMWWEYFVRAHAYQCRTSMVSVEVYRAVAKHNSVIYLYDLPNRQGWV